MKARIPAQITLGGESLSIDLSKAICLSTALRRNECNPNAYFLPQPKFLPFRTENFIASVAEGGAVNCEIICLAAHGNGTHTECVGHISRTPYFIRDCAPSGWYRAKLVSISAHSIDGELLLPLHSIDTATSNFHGEALIIRSVEASSSLLQKNWSGTNPPYLEPGSGRLLRQRGIRHLLVDLPSVDREQDGGKLLVHHEFWNYPVDPRLDATITEMIVVPDEVADGEYVLQLHTLPLESDASPSGVYLYEIEVVHD